MGRPKGSKNKKFSDLRAKMPLDSQKRAAEKTQNMLAELDKAAEIEESEVVVSKRESASDKWNIMNNEGRLEIIREMTNKGLLTTSLKHPIEDSFKGLEEIDTRFECMLYEAQDKISNYLRKR